MVIINISRIKILSTLTNLEKPFTIKKDVVVNKKQIDKVDMVAKVNSFSPEILKLIPTLKLRITIEVKNSKLMHIKIQNPGGISFIVPVASSSFICVEPY